ncbi:CAAX protease [Corynebacterium phocae]|uniref:CAAX protease n=1 Tax=Corynebacterium phocae TaxID=161895 RepID=A0A1L7D5M4_9CORY|nr:CPBP family intramembrane glutamic endopeptidase [Corynebacterium phocae]APT93438.1 CAAX protease [Corynebacterium phocae]KAA8721132.1 CPBP family intramembrane metalloprotease [Corynebacterium phocae]
MTRLRQEILLVLALSFGMAGLRSALRLADAYLRPEALNHQSVALSTPYAQVWWIDFGLQLCSAGVLFSWGFLALFLLAGEGLRLPKLQLRDWRGGALLAALIGIPGLIFYLTALHLGWTKEVIPTTFDNPWVEMPTLLLRSAANAFAEEVVVIFWFLSRLTRNSPVRNLGWHPYAAILAAAALRGSYHLYQGVSAGFGNIAMGLLFGYVYYRTGKIWPLILAHFLIDAVAFLGYALGIRL